MTKEKLEIYINALSYCRKIRVLDESDKKWKDDQVPDASLIGFLQGSIKGVITNFKLEIDE
jgi:hypothetical protein